MQAPAWAQAQPVATKVVIFKDADVPVAGAPSSPDSLAELFAEAGYAVTFATAKQLAAPGTLTPARCDLLILPYGASFPRQAAPALRRFPRAGGSFISMGVYAFDNIYGEAKDSTPALRNRGFEQPGAWRPSASDAVFERADACAHSGKFSFKIHTPTSSPSRRWRHIYQRLDLKANGLYALSAFLRTQNMKGGRAYVAVDFYNKRNHRIGYVQQAGKSVADDTDGWVKVGTSEFLTPPGTAYSRAKLILYGHGTVY